MPTHLTSFIKACLDDVKIKNLIETAKVNSIRDDKIFCSCRNGLNEKIILTAAAWNNEKLEVLCKQERHLSQS